MTEREAAHYIGMSGSWLRKSRMDGYLEGRIEAPPHVQIGRSVRYLREDLDAWLEAHREGSGAA